MHGEVLLIEGAEHIAQAGEGAAAVAEVRLGAAGLHGGEVVGAEHHVLRRRDDRLAGGWREDVVAGEHQHARLGLSLDRQGHMHGHLVTVEVGVEGGAHQRVKLDGTAIHQLGLEGLDAEAVQRRGAVQQDRVPFDHLLQHLHHLIVGALNQLLGGLDVVDDVLTDQAMDHERLEQLDRHLLGQTALVHLQLRTHHDHGTTGVVDPLTQQVLTEATLLALNDVAERLEWTVVGADHGATAAAVVDQGIDSLLEHPLLVADDDLGSQDLLQPRQAVVAVDHPAVEIIQIAGGEAAAIELHHRAQVGRNHRDHIQHHPLRTGAGGDEVVDHAQALDQLGALLTLGAGDLLAQLLGHHRQIEILEELLERFGADAHLGLVLDLRILGIDLILDLQPLVLGEQLLVGEVLVVARIEHHVAVEVDDLLNVAQWHVEQDRHVAGDPLQVPDVRHRGRQLDEAHAVAPHPALGDLHAAALADDAAVAHPLVLAAVALPVLRGAEDLLAEQAVHLRLERAVVDGFGLGHLAHHLTIGQRALAPLHHPFG